jgi:hypothetical protein
MVRDNSCLHARDRQVVLQERAVIKQNCGRLLETSESILPVR